jgi:deazaflavin-dependent oxidoreductase (nitroreductase family)
MKLYDTALETFVRSRVGGWMFVNVFTHVDRFLLGKTNGRLSVGLGSRFNKDVVLLGCTGARSGLKREVPLLSTPVDGELVLIASKAGAPEHPAWFGNLKANPVCTLTMGGRSVECSAREVKGAERQRYWRAALENNSGYADYQERTQRLIPVIVLTPQHQRALIIRHSAAARPTC